MVRSAVMGVQTRVVSRRVEDGSAVPFSVLVSCSAVAGPQIDITSNLIAAVAHSLWEARGGDSLANWADAESIIAGLLSPSATPPPPAAAGAPPSSAGAAASSIAEAKPRSAGKPSAAAGKQGPGSGKPGAGGGKRSSRR